MELEYESIAAVEKETTEEDPHDQNVGSCTMATKLHLTQPL